MKSYCLFLALILGVTSTAFASFSKTSQDLFGSDPLHPSPESKLGQYLAESHAYSFSRTFSFGEQAVPGPERLVVLVSPESFPLFQKYFGTAPFLYQFHEPHQHAFVAAFKGHRGGMGRLGDDLRFTYAGVLLIPILLKEKEEERVEMFFDLASKTKRKNDVALFPWRLADSTGTPYCEKGSEKPLANWFASMPVGVHVDRNQKMHSYDVAGLQPEIQSLVQQVWTRPYSHQSLAKTLGLETLETQMGASTPGRIAAALLTTASQRRVPVIFRYIDDHKAAFDAKFDTYVDLEFNPIDAHE